jgi:hypothetical protein
LFEIDRITDFVIIIIIIIIIITNKTFLLKKWLLVSHTVEVLQLLDGLFFFSCVQYVTISYRNINDNKLKQIINKFLQERRLHTMKQKSQKLVTENAVFVQADTDKITVIIKSDIFP